LSLLVAILTIALAAAVVIVVSAPLRSARRRSQPAPSGTAAPAGEPSDGERPAGAGGEDSSQPGGSAMREDLEAAREAKYQEIRDAELDYRTGKLSREDYEAIDSELRAEAIEILDRLELEER
jgi:hypothetical protein